MLCMLILATALSQPPAALADWRHAGPAQWEAWLEQLPTEAREQRLYQLIQALGADAEPLWLQGYSRYRSQVLMPHPEAPGRQLPRWPIADQARAALVAQEHRQWQQQWRSRLSQGELDWHPDQAKALARWLVSLDDEAYGQAEALLRPSPPTDTAVLAALAERSLSPNWLQALWQATVTADAIRVLRGLPGRLPEPELARALQAAAENEALRSLAWNLLATTEPNALWRELDGPDAALAAAALARSPHPQVPERLAELALQGHVRALWALKLGGHKRQLRALAERLPHNRELDPWR
ncbi:hypothetical protein [Gallaecimonas sp. GXIMD4217]|uniref:hypothetical protein n=1 Tax=Gallaecimonas sp. GXIMD4217 TaxID=3131927 RepID=UPI00311B13A2